MLHLDSSKLPQGGPPSSKLPAIAHRTLGTSSAVGSSTSLDIMPDLAADGLDTSPTPCRGILQLSSIMLWLAGVDAESPGVLPCKHHLQVAVARHYCEQLSC